jgi:two-component system response regulator HupR/HoxA
VADVIPISAGPGGTLRDRIDALEVEIIRETLMRHHWNKSRTADELGLSRVGLRAKMERYGLEKIIILNPKKAAS